ncbi:sugar ABC transporter substrate-binding protein [Pullulanibacillus camelliae]|uniref:Sugar ABC transporter substrate-binding protein n=1 Tax=Pullulanibacillus camelliae TaxID=1707096 RepID=A0A8J2VDD1_9BACL|nr:sugar ABC transporter substrate-binding protein [Pullulanibacillus camelliae]GGE27389.1 sugar ABC transporter substrate-binding protein [Pullulanibacillus camelliae]
MKHKKGVSKHQWFFWIAGIILLMIFTTACGSQSNSDGTSSSGGKKKTATIALLLPETGTSARYESQDKPDFEAAVKDLNPDIKVIYQNAQGDEQTQQKQAESAITSGAKVLVIDPQDSKAAATIVRKAQDADVKVISYDRLILNAKEDYYISFNNEKVGELQGKYIADHTPKGGTVVMINGAQSDNNALLFRKGAHTILDPLFKDKTLVKGYESYTPEWLADNALRETEQALTKLDNKVDAVLAANDGNAGAAIKALKAQGLAGKVPVTGQDATDDGLRNIVLGTQSMSVYKDVKKEATAAAQLAVALAEGKAPPKGLVNGKTNNNMTDVPSVLLDPIAVTKDNLADTVIKDGYTTWDKICTGDAAQKCPEH